MKIISVIAWTTFREWMREKFFWVAVFLSLFLMGLSLLLSQLTFAEEQKIMTDFGFSAIELSILIVVSFSGAYVIAKEVDKQTCLLLLARPLSRMHFLMGKWLGLTYLSFLLFASSSLVLFVLLGPWDEAPRYFFLALSFYLKGLVILSFTMMTSFFVRPILSLLAGVSLYLMGHWLDDLAYFAKRSQNSTFQFFSETLNYIIPQFYRFNWKSFYYLENGFDREAYRSMILHYFVWSSIYLFVANLMFRRKDIV